MKRMKKLVSLVLSTIIVLAMTIPAASNGTSDVVITEVFAASDYQGPSGDAESERTLGALIDAMKRDGHTAVEGSIFAGDYDYKLGIDTAHGIISAKQVLQTKWSDLNAENMVFIRGNHDLPGTAGLAASGANDKADYGVFVINESDYKWLGNDRAVVEKTAENLKNYLDNKIKAQYGKPIFVVSHLPLHYSMRTRKDGDGTYANLLFDVLNQAGEQGLNIIFLFGHDHSNGWDDYLGGSCVYLAKGDKINIAQSSQTEFKEETLHFTYMNPGYTGYYGKVNDGCEGTLTSTVFTIYEDRVAITRYSADGKYNLKSKGVTNTYQGESGYSPDIRVIESTEYVLLSKVASKPYVTIKSTRENRILVGDSILLTAEVGNLSDPIYSWSCSDEGILKVADNGKEAVVTASGNGETVVRLSVEGEEGTAEAEYRILAVDTSLGEVYSLVENESEIVSGGQYIILFDEESPLVERYTAVSTEYADKGKRKGLVPKKIDFKEKSDFISGNWDDLEWTFTEKDGAYEVSCSRGTLQIGDSYVNADGESGHTLNVIFYGNQVCFRDNGFELSDSSAKVFSGYSSGKRFCLYRRLLLAECEHENTEIRNRKAANCTEKGYTGDTVCLGCGKVLERGQETEALGHDWDDGVITTEPTDTEEGVRTFQCKRQGCEVTRTEKIPKLKPGETKPEETNPSEPSDAVSPKTGDGFQMEMWVIIMAADMIAILFLLLRCAHRDGYAER